MKSSALACYLEAIANAVRLSKSATVPHIKWTSFKGPRVLHVGSTSIPVPDHQGETDLAAIFPDAIPAGDTSHGSKVEARNVAADIATMQAACDSHAADARLLRSALANVESRLKDSQDSNRRNLAGLEAANREVEALRAEADALRQTVARMRAGKDQTVAGVPVIAPAPRQAAPAPTGDLLSLIVADQAGQSVKAPATAPASVPGQVVVCFRLNRQGKTLADAGVSLDDLRTRFTFRFIDPKDATRGGFWLAKDATAPGTHLMVQRLSEAGAIIGDTIPASLAY